MGIYGRNDDRRPLREFDGPLEGGRFRADHGTRQRRAAAPQRTGAPQQKLAAANRRPGTAPRARRPKSRRGKMAIIGLGIVIAFVLAAQSLMQQNVGTGRRSAPTQEETAHSTPAHAWRKGEVPSCTKSTPNGPTNPMREETSTRTDAARPAFPWSTYRSRERPTSIPWQWRASASKTASPSTA